jgi:surface polysaccharide O-acyltransferase-like enzyme
VGRLNWCDLVRAIACAMVVALHVSGPFIPIGSISGWHSIPALLEAATRPAVPFFFMLSGYLWFKSDRPVTPSVAWKRIARSALPLIFYTAIYSILDYFSIGTTVPNPMVTPVFYHLWFFYAYLIVTALLLFLRPSTINPELGAAICFVILACCAGGMSTFGYGHAFETISGSAVYLLYSFAGFFLANSRASGRLAFIAACIFVGGALMTAYLTNSASVAAGTLDQSYYGYNAALVVLMAFCGFYGLKYIGERIGYESWIVKNVSAVSLGIFGLHPLILNFALLEIGRGNQALLLAFAVSFFGTWALAFILSRVPFGRLVA